MEISPITGMRILPVVKVPPADAGLSKVFDIENSSQAGDDSYSGSRKKAAGGEDDDAEVTEEGMGGESAVESEPARPVTQINYFA